MCIEEYRKSWRTDRPICPIATCHLKLAPLTFPRFLPGPSSVCLDSSCHYSSSPSRWIPMIFSSWDPWTSLVFRLSAYPQTLLYWIPSAFLTLRMHAHSFSRLERRRFSHSVLRTHKTPPTLIIPFLFISSYSEGLVGRRKDGEEKVEEE